MAGNVGVVSLFQVDGRTDAKIQSIKFDNFPLHQTQFAVNGVWPLLMPGVSFRCTTASQAETASSHTTGPWKMAFTKILSCHLMVDLLLFAVVLVTFICWAPVLRNGSRLSKWTEKFTHWPSVLIRAACTVTEVCCFVFSSSLQFSLIFSASPFV